MKRAVDDRARLHLWPLAACALLSAGLAQAQTPPPAAPAASPASTPTAAPAPAKADTGSGKSGGGLGALPSAASMRPTGQITVTADHSEWVKGASMELTGNVVLVSNTLRMHGDRMQLQQFGAGQYLAHLYGNLAHFDHTGDGPDNPSVSGDAKTMVYDSRTGIVDLTDEAHVKRAKDEINGQHIRYNVPERHVEASGVEGHQVKIIIDSSQDGIAPAVPPEAAPAAPAARTAPAAPPPASSAGTAP